MTNSKKYIYALGRRKEASARVRIYPKWSGSFTVIRKDKDDISLKEYFGWHKYLYEDALYPLTVLDKDLKKTIDMEFRVEGGWIRGHAEAIRLGIARALTELSPDYRTQLKPYGFLKRDPRAKERKKPGKRKARKSPEWSKR